MKKFIAIVDYGMGNLRSVQKACEHVGLNAVITGDKKDIINADRIILPGVGAFPDAMSHLIEAGLDSVIISEVKKGKLLLGICLGMQLLCTESFEDALSEDGAKEATKGLDLIKASVVKFKNNEKIPQIGWNSITFVNKGLFSSLNSGMYVYFAHSYHAVCESKNVLTETEYGYKYPSGIYSDNVYGLQFHPEKSGEEGLKIFKNFAELKNI